MTKARSGFILLFSLIWLFLFGFLAMLQAQEEKVTLILQSSEEIPCRILKIAYGNVYFDAASARLAFKYGDVIEIEKIASVRLGDGRTLSMDEFLELRRATTPSKESPAPPSLPARTERVPSSTPAPKIPPPPSGPGVRLTTRQSDTTRKTSAIGLRLPDVPPPSPPSSPINYIELANLLAETGVAGKLLYEIKSGTLQGRELTKSQKELIDTILQSPFWAARKRDLREAQRIAKTEFELMTQRQPNLLSEQFHFRPSARDHAFEEFVQFLHIENAIYFQDKWQQVETILGEEAAMALQDILNNYEDWHYLFGEKLENR